MDYKDSPELDEVVSIKRYVCLYLINYIPFVNVIWMIIKAFDVNENKSYRNLCKAHLIMIVASIGLVILLWIIIIVIAVGVSIATS